jgi:hypothetical protein
MLMRNPDRPYAITSAIPTIKPFRYTSPWKLGSRNTNTSKINDVKIWQTMILRTLRQKGVFLYISLRKLTLLKTPSLSKVLIIPPPSFSSNECSSIYTLFIYSYSFNASSLNKAYTLFPPNLSAISFKSVLALRYFFNIK